MAKRVMVSVTVSRYVEFPDDAEITDVFTIDGLFDGIDGSMWDLVDDSLEVDFDE